MEATDERRVGTASQAVAGAFAGLLLGFLAPLVLLDPSMPREAWTLCSCGAVVGAVSLAVVGAVVRIGVSPLWLVPIVVFAVIWAVPWFPYEKAGIRLPDLPVGAAYVNVWDNWPVVLAWHLLATVGITGLVLAVAWTANRVQRP